MSYEKKWKEFQNANRLDEAPKKKKKVKKGTMSAEKRKALRARTAQSFATTAYNSDNAGGFEDWGGELADRGLDPNFEFELSGQTMTLKDVPAGAQAALLTSGAFPSSSDYIERNPEWSEKYGQKAAVLGKTSSTNVSFGGGLSIKTKDYPHVAVPAAPAVVKPVAATVAAPVAKPAVAKPAVVKPAVAKPAVVKTAVAKPAVVKTAVNQKAKMSDTFAGAGGYNYRALPDDSFYFTGPGGKPGYAPKGSKAAAAITNQRPKTVAATVAKPVAATVAKPVAATVAAPVVDLDTVVKPSQGWLKRAIFGTPEAQSKRNKAANLSSDDLSSMIKENISFEKKWKNYQRIVESVEPSHLTSPFQQKMKKRRSRNDVYTTPSGHKNPSVGSPFSTKSKSFGKSGIYFENMNEAEQEVLDSFELQNELNPASFSGDKMIPEIRGRLMEIAQDFLDGIDFKMDVEDITLTGSLANYNWSKYSDFDLHILVDYSAVDADPDLVKRFFQDIKAIWNIRHNIFLKGYEVEVYVQNTNEDHMSSGVYSVQNDEWVLKPEQEETARSPVDKPNIEKKADDIIFQIDRAEKLLAAGKLDDALDAIDRLKQKVRNLRKIGLSKEDGVYSVENLAFKTLRRSMELERLSTLKNKAYDRQMSITQ